MRLVQGSSEVGIMISLGGVTPPEKTGDTIQV
jgi:hypothetical protein